jgi:hypothetical protein
VRCKKLVRSRPTTNQMLKIRTSVNSGCILERRREEAAGYRMALDRFARQELRSTVPNHNPALDQTHPKQGVLFPHGCTVCVRIWRPKPTFEVACISPVVLLNKDPPLVRFRSISQYQKRTLWVRTCRNAIKSGMCLPLMLGVTCLSDNSQSAAISYLSSGRKRERARAREREREREREGEG